MSHRVLKDLSILPHVFSYVVGQKGDKANYGGRDIHDDEGDVENHCKGDLQVAFLFLCEFSTLEPDHGAGLGWGGGLS